ncbi:MAG: glycosyltransferase family 2 protein [Planctomycetales bacterium]|nr:glycosyltransferase family 2 protein [Planctomycetales bacterium]
MIDFVCGSLFRKKTDVVVAVMTVPFVAVVILNYRTPGMVIECLKSLDTERAAAVPGLRCLVVDGASGDDSVKCIAEAIEKYGWSDWVDLKPLDMNGGFAFGNNAGIGVLLSQPCPPDYLMLLNPDTLVRPRAVAALVAVLEAHPEAGIVGSQLEDVNGKVEPSARRSPGVFSELAGAACLGVLDRLLASKVVTMPVLETRQQCDWVSGAAMMVRRQVFEQIGLLDEGYFLYFEELDFCDRARAAGWEVWHEPASRVMHLEGASTGVSAPHSRRSSHWYDSRRRYFVKQYGLLRWIAADAAWTVGRASLMLRRLLRLGGGSTVSEPRRQMRDLIGGDLWALFSGRIWSHRQ